ncbi:MAG TPA: DUF480 domain-containing protein [Egibacteraceae bacterium]|nr:DUF480 domain-containing protein [Egibacteraceae bacterium]
MDLSAQEVRVLGALVEKQLATPQAYPLTESALVAACNQSTNRDPVVSYERATVRRCLLSLRQRGLARMVHRPGDRVEKHRHLVDEALGLDGGQLAVLCVLMLRGPQTAGELRTRTERLHGFATPDEVDEALQRLVERDPEPLARRVERQPGQHQARFTHLLSADTPDSDAVAPPAPVTIDAPVIAGPTPADEGPLRVLQSRVLLRPGDFDRSTDFYEHRWGLVRYREWGHPGSRGVVYFLGGGYLELTEGGVGPAPSGIRLWLQVPDAQAAYQRLRAVGVDVDEPPRTQPWGLIEMSVADPDGLELVVVEVPDSHPLRRDTRS